MAATAYPATSTAWPSTPPPDTLLNTTSKGTPLWPPPAIFFKMEFGLSLAPDSRHNFSVDYASRPFNDSRLARRIPNCLVPSAHRGRRAVSDQSRAQRSRSENTARPGMPVAHAPLFAAPPPHPQQPSAYPPPHATTSAQQQQRPHPLHQNPPRPTPRRLLTRQAIERKPLPELPSRFRLGEPELPWTSPVMPMCDSPDLPYSAISPPSSIWPDLAVPRGSISSPSTPLISPQASFASLARSRERTLSCDTQPGRQRTLSEDAQSSCLDTPPGRQETLVWNAQTSSWDAQPERQRKLSWNAQTLTWEAPPARHGAFSWEAQPERPPDSEATDDAAATAWQPKPESLLEAERDAREREERMLAVDPQRARELAIMQSAMMSFDALGDASPWDSAGGQARGPPRDLGWAVRVEPASEGGEPARAGWEGPGYWQAYNSEEWERADRPWTYGDVNGFSSYWLAPRRRSWTGVPVGT